VVIEWIIRVGIGVSFVGAVVFVVSYAAFFNWRKRAAGRSLLFAFTALVALSALGFVNGLLGNDYPGREPLRALIWWTVAFGIERMVWVLWRRRRDGEEAVEERPRHTRHKEGENDE
jgi:hypothetical protein